MLLKARKPAYIDPVPASFAALMELYEHNYIRLRQLCPDLGTGELQRVSRVPGAMDLHLQILEQGPYTTTLLLSYRFTASNGRRPRSCPNLMLRMYHDARQVEVLGRTPDHGGGQHCRGGAGFKWRDLHARWRLNRFLYKWLGYCQHQGHSFS